MKERRDASLDSRRVLITVDEAARRLSIGRSHIYEQMRRGSLRSVRIGRSRRILERDLDDFVEQLLEGHRPELLGGQSLASHAAVKARVPLRSGRR
jgi:excisionase family DNA binding protein